MTNSTHYIIITKYTAWERIDRSEYIDHMLTGMDQLQVA